MKAKELLDANQLSAAIAELTQQVKSHPADTRLRTFLFETLCFAGEYNRAEKQLEALAQQDEVAGIGIEIYRQLIKAEQVRRQVYAGTMRPTFLLAPPAYADLHVTALKEIHDRRGSSARGLLDRAVSQRQALKGWRDGKPFASCRDSDDVLAPFLECFVKGTYVWLPLEQVHKLTVGKPRHLRDLLWMHATAEINEGPTGDLFIPVMYAGSEQSENDLIRLGRITEWLDGGEGIAVAQGQRTFIVDDRELSVLEVGELQFEVPARV